MKIRTRLKLINLIFVVVVLAFIFSAYFTQSQIQRAFKKERITREIRTEVFDRIILTYDYLMYRSERAKRQWWLVYEEITKLLSSEAFQEPEERIILEGVINGQQITGEVFSTIIKNYEKRKGTEKPTEMEEELEKRLVSQLLLKSQAIRAGCSQLADLVEQDIIHALWLAIAMNIIMLTILAMVVVVNSLLTMRTISQPITKLHQGTEIIGRGNLDFKVGISAQDEIGQLSRAFDEMVRNLKESQEKIIRSEKLAALGKLAGAVGHELRNPLGVIRNSVYFLRMRLGRLSEDEKVKKHLDILDTETNTSDRIITDILAFGRVKEPRFATTSINNVVQGAIAKAGVLENVEVSAELNADLPLIQADAGQLTHVFSNLMVNAIQAMPHGGSLRISTRAQNEFVEVGIADTGEGIPKENLQKIFEPLFSTRAQGTGLGLSVCQSIVEKHKGAIDVESEVGKGTKVRVKLPITQEG